MIPPYISEDVKSTGEKLIYNLFQNDPDTEDWVVLHSLALSKHTKRLYGEIDFLVLAPDLGVFCLEVKSGSVKRENGIWIFTNRYGESTTRTRGPFEQAQEGMFSLLESIRRKFGKEHRLSKVLFGFGVMFPHVIFPAEGPDQEGWQIYDRDSRRLPVSSFICQLSKKTLDKMKNIKTDVVLPTKEDVRQLVDYLRGDFERLVRKKDLISEIEEELERYTSEQFLCLDQLEDNPRCLFLGAAGTGKTMIAMESARRKVFKNKRVLFICFNALLANWLQELQITTRTEKLAISTFHRFLEQLASANPNCDISDLERNDEYFKYDLPLLALTSIDEGYCEPFDHIIVDEGQDLLRPEYLDVLDALLLGGLKGGSWEIYADLEKQAIYSEYSSQEMLSMLEERSSFARFKLRVNCRNTKMIGEQTSILTGFEEPPFLPAKVEGIPVEYIFCEKNDLTPKLELLLRRLRSEGIPPESITILSPYRLENSCVCRVSNGIDIINLNKVGKFRSGMNKLSFSTIQGFKGLENSYIILTDINSLSNDVKSLLYIGMSRAKVGLFVIMNQSVEKEYKELVKRSLVS
jgi:hypothetical protein